MCRAIRESKRRRARARGAFVLEYVIAVAFVAIAIMMALIYEAGPSLAKTFRATQRAAAAPIP